MRQLTKIRLNLGRGWPDVTSRGDVQPAAPWPDAWADVTSRGDVWLGTVGLETTFPSRGPVDRARRSLWRDVPICFYNSSPSVS